MKPTNTPDQAASEREKKLHHVWGEKNEKFFERIDAFGGWPLNAKSAILKHASDFRECYFSTQEHVRDGWNTSIVTADEYYTWKLSDRAKELLRIEGRRQCHDAIYSLGVYKP